MPVHIVYYPGTLGLVPDTLLFFIIDSNIFLIVRFTRNAKSLVLTFLVAILFEPLFVYHVS